MYLCRDEDDYSDEEEEEEDDDDDDEEPPPDYLPSPQSQPELEPRSRRCLVGDLSISIIPEGNNSSEEEEDEEDQQREESDSDGPVLYKDDESDEDEDDDSPPSVWMACITIYCMCWLMHLFNKKYNKSINIVKINTTLTN